MSMGRILGGPDVHSEANHEDADQEGEDSSDFVKASFYIYYFIGHLFLPLAQEVLYLSPGQWQRSPAIWSRVLPDLIVWDAIMDTDVLGLATVCVFCPRLYCRIIGQDARIKSDYPDLTTLTHRLLCVYCHSGYSLKKRCRNRFSSHY